MCLLDGRELPLYPCIVDPTLTGIILAVVPRWFFLMNLPFHVHSSVDFDSSNQYCCVLVDGQCGYMHASNVVEINFRNSYTS